MMGKTKRQRFLVGYRGNMQLLYAAGSNVVTPMGKTEARAFMRDARRRLKAAHCSRGLVLYEVTEVPRIAEWRSNTSPG